VFEKHNDPNSTLLSQYGPWTTDKGTFASATDNRKLRRFSTFVSIQLIDYIVLKAYKTKKREEQNDRRQKKEKMRAEASRGARSNAKLRPIAPKGGTLE
jgi:hypothetical protein